MSQSGSKDLALRASRGNAGAFSKLVRSHSGLVYRVARNIIGPNEAEDACQETWERAWRHIGGFRGESAFSTWLYKITVNTCLSARKKEARMESQKIQQELPHLPGPTGGEDDPETAALNSERRSEIREALQHLRADHRAALVLRHMEGLSYREIAEVLDVPDGTAKGWVSRGRATLLVVLNEAREKRHLEDQKVSG
jgi:RNA polymerase sigma-70 factor, ECF subfamily